MTDGMVEFWLVTVRTAPTVLVIICGLALNYRQWREQPRVFNLLTLAAIVEIGSIVDGFLWRFLISDSDQLDVSHFISFAMYITIHECLNAVCWALMLWAVLGAESRPKTSITRPD